MDLSSKLKDAHFSGFPNVDWSKILKRREIEIECGTIAKNIGEKDIFRAFVTNRLEYKFEQNNSKILSVQENSMMRPNYEKQMNAVRQIVPMDNLQSTYKHRSCHIVSGIILLVAYVWRWKREMKRLGITGVSSSVVLQSLYSLYFLYKDYVSLLNIDQYNLLLAFYDSSQHEAFLVELFKLKGVKTATLQHGMFSAFKENTFINSGVELRSFHSDYFLAWNKMTIEEAILQGVDSEKFIECGILGYVGKEYQECINPNNKTFGVVIGHPSFEEENIKLVEGANTLSKHLGYKFLLKLHPNYKEDYFDKIVDQNCFVGIVPKGCDMLKYANMVEFSLCGSSSVFAELVYVNHNTIRYSSRTLTDKFKNVSFGKYFTDPNALPNVFGTGFDKEDQRELFKYLCGSQDVTINYKKFLDNYC